MNATITSLEREIVREERAVGLHEQPITPEVITGRQVQVSTLIVLFAAALLGVSFSPHGTTSLRMLTALFACLLALYGIDQDRHLRRLERLSDDTRVINLAVVDALAGSGALASDAEALIMRESAQFHARAIVDRLADLVLADIVRVRIAGPSGEVPLAAVHCGAIDTPDDPAIARYAIRRGHAVQHTGADGRTVLAVPIVHHSEPVFVLELVSPALKPYEGRDAATIEAFGRGVLAAL
jgi:hypothetical protein